MAFIRIILRVIRIYSGEDQLQTGIQTAIHKFDYSYWIEVYVLRMNVYFIYNVFYLISMIFFSMYNKFRLL